jgi:phospho-N-acetylmuramoyl-pentapeptide-transferase
MTEIQPYLQRVILAFITATGLGLLLGPLLLPMLRKLKMGQQVRDDGPQSHLLKQGTPTMGGILFLISASVVTLIFGERLSLGSPVTLTLLATFGFGFVGFLDDFIKLRRHRSLGLRAWQKIVAQFALALLLSIWLRRHTGTSLYLPGGKEWDLGVFYIPFAMFVLIAEVNAVNLTDGLDGLAGSVSAVYMGSYAILFLILMGGIAPAFSEGFGSMASFSAALCGALLAYLAFNAYPARVFMGDTGALALGGAVAMVGLVSRSAMLLPLSGICFAASALSVVLQVGSYKLRKKKRVFRMAPLHHHFELGGAHEVRIVTGYTIATCIGCAVCLLFYTL